MIMSDTFQYLPISFAATIFFSNNNSGKLNVSAAQKPWYLYLNEPLRLIAALNFPKSAQLF